MSISHVIVQCYFNNKRKEIKSACVLEPLRVFQDEKKDLPTKLLKIAVRELLVVGVL